MRLYSVNSENQISRKCVYEEIRPSGFILQREFLPLFY